MIEAMRIAALLNLESDMAGVLRGIAAELKNVTKLMETATKVAGKLAEALDRAPSGAGFAKIDDAILKTEGLFEALTKKVNDYRGAVGGLSGAAPAMPSGAGPRSSSGGGPRTSTGTSLASGTFGFADDYANATWENVSRDAAYRQQRAEAERMNAERARQYGASNGGLAPLEDVPFGVPRMTLDPRAPKGGEMSLLGAAGKILNIAYMAEMTVQTVGSIITQSAGFNDEQSRLQQRGASKADLDSASDTVFSIAQSVPGRTMQEITKDIATLRSVLGESSDEDKLSIVKKVLPHFEEVAAALSAGTGDTSENSMHMLLRSVEMMGGAVNPETGKLDPTRLMATLDLAERALMVVTPIGKANDFYQMMKQGSMVFKTMEPEEAFKMVLALVLDTGGSRTGTALQALGRQFFGGIMTGKTAEELARLGILKPDDFDMLPGKRGIKLTEAGNKHLQDELKGGFFEFFDKIVRPAMIAHGIVTEEDQTREMFKILSTDTGRRIGSLFSTQADQVRKEMHLFDETPSPERQLKIAKDTNIGYNMQAVSAAWTNMLEAAGKADAGPIISLLHATAFFFNSLAGNKYGFLVPSPIPPHTDRPPETKGSILWDPNPLHWFGLGSGDNDNAPAAAAAGIKDLWNGVTGGTAGGADLTAAQKHALVGKVLDGWDEARAAAARSAHQDAAWQPNWAAMKPPVISIYLDGRAIAGALVKTIVRSADGPISGNPAFDSRRLYST